MEADIKTIDFKDIRQGKKQSIIVKTGINEANQIFYALDDTYRGEKKPIRIVNPSEQRKVKDEFKDNSIAKRWVKYLAYQGVFDKKFTPEQINLAKKEGVLPHKGNIPLYNVHHIIPIEFGGTNEFANLCVIHQKVHRALHDEFWNKIKEIWKETSGEKFVVIRDMDPFMTDHSLFKLFPPEVCKKITKNYKNSIRRSQNNQNTRD